LYIFIVFSNTSGCLALTSFNNNHQLSCVRQYIIYSYLYPYTCLYHLRKFKHFPHHRRNTMNVLYLRTGPQSTADNTFGVRFTFSSPHAVRYATSFSPNEYKWAPIVIHADLVLRPFVLRLFPLTPFCQFTRLLTFKPLSYSV